MADSCPAQPRYEYAFALWSNSTLGLLCHWWMSNKTQEGRGTTTVTSIPEITTLDVRALSAAQHRSFQGREQEEPLSKKMSLRKLDDKRVYAPREQVPQAARMPLIRSVYSGRQPASSQRRCDSNCSLYTIMLPLSPQSLAQRRDERSSRIAAVRGQEIEMFRRNTRLALHMD